MTLVRKYSEPVQILHRFIKTAGMDEDFSFECPALPVPLDKKYVHRMRVELSRIREQVRETGRTPKAFKLVHVRSDVSEDDDSKMTVVIRKSNKRNDASQFLDKELLEGMLGV